MSNPSSAIAGKGQEKKGKSTAPVPIPELREDSATVGALDGPLRMAAGDSVPSQASWLGEGRLHSAQRHALATRIGRVQGNQHLQRVVASLNRSPADRGSRHASGGSGQRERPAQQAPPGSHPGEEREFSEEAIEASAQVESSVAGDPPSVQAAGRTGDGRWVQRGLLDEVSAAARSLYNQVTGQADSAGSDSQRKSQARSSELEGEATTSEATLRADAAAQGAELQAEGLASASQLEALASAEGQGLQAQATVAQAGLQGNWGQLQGEVASMEGEIRGQAETQETDLREATATFTTQVESGWTERREQATSQMSDLEREARGQYASSQSQAMTLLENSGSTTEDLTAGARAIESGWNDFASRLNPFKGLLDGLWDRVSSWANRLWDPLIAKARRALSWIGDKIQTVWRSMQQKWRRIRDLVTGVRTRLRQMASQVLNQLRARARQAWNNLKARAISAWTSLKERAQGVWRSLRDKGMSFISGLRQKGGGALSSISQIAASITRILRSMVTRVLSRLRGTINAAVAALRNKERSLLDRIKGLGRVVYSGVRDIGTQVYQGLRTTGTRVVDLLRAAGTGVLRLLGSAWERVRGGWDALRGRVGPAFEGIMRRARSLVTGLRERVFQPAWEWLKDRWGDFKNGTFFALLKLIRGWIRLRRWASSAWPRAQSGDPESEAAVGREARQKASAPFESVFYKRRAGGVTKARDPRVIQAQLGRGRALEGGVRSRLESAFGQSLAHVRVHTDAQASRLSRDLDARAFAVGRHVAFGAGEYRPGTLIGDALIAHETAHVLQQGGTAAGPIQKGQVEDPAIEMDADRSAIHAVASTWMGTRNALARIPATAIPRLRSGLRLSTCKKCPEGTPAPTVKIGQVTAPNTPSSIDRIPPRVPQDVQVDISGWQDCMDPITLMPEGMSGVSGRVTLDGEKEREIESDGSHTIKVVGTKQTITPNGTLRLVAWLGDRRGKRLAQSNSFYVAAYPSAISFSPGKKLQAESFRGNLLWAQRYHLSFTSDSGVNKDCDETSITERIQAGGGTGVLANLPVKKSTFIKTEKPQHDDHGIFHPSVAGARAKIDTAPTSSAQQDQFFRFACNRTGVEWDLHNGPIVPGSGFKISLRVSKAGGKYFLHVSKQGAQYGGAGPGSVSDSAEKAIEI